MAAEQLQQLVAAGFGFVRDVREELREGRGGRRVRDEVLERFAPRDVGVVGEEGEVVGGFGVGRGRREVQRLRRERDGFGAEGGRGVVARLRGGFADAEFGFLEREREKDRVRRGRWWRKRKRWKGRVL